MHGKHGVRIVAGPVAKREHVVVVIVETVRILPSLPMEESMRELEEGASLF